MIQAAIPINETERLTALEALQVMDTPMEERFERITRMVCRLLRVPMATVSLIAGDRQWFKSVRGLSARETPRDISFCSHTILQDETMVVPDATKDERFFDNPLVTGNDHIQFYAGHPLHASDGSRIGSLCAIDNKPRDFSEEDRQTLQDLANMVESELRAKISCQAQTSIARELDAEKRRSMIDSLTGIWNRPGILEMLRREFSEAQRTGAHLGIIMGDLDHFKNVNDTYGHPVGDQVLREIAQKLVYVVRTHDSVGRIGGEEFLILLPNCETKRVTDIAHRLCAKIAENAFHYGGLAIAMTISLGAVSGPVTTEDTTADWIKRADEAMYRAKELGRNQVVVYPMSPVIEQL